MTGCVCGYLLSWNPSRSSIQPTIMARIGERLLELASLAIPGVCLRKRADGTTTARN